MTTQVDIEVPFDTWLDLNTVTGIGTGVELIIQNKGAVPVLIYESVTQPLDTFYEGGVLYTSPDFPSIAEVDLNSDRIWVRSGSDYAKGLLNVQGVE